MTNFYKVVFILVLLFLAVDAKHKTKKKIKIKKSKDHHKIFKNSLFTVPYLPPLYDNDDGNNNNYGDNNPPLYDNGDDGNNNYGNNDTPTFKDLKPVEEDLLKPVEEVAKKVDFELASIGRWDLISPDSGVSAMHINLLPTNKIIIIDALIYRVSRIKLPNGVPCVPYKDLKTQEDKIDCFAHSAEYDIETNQVRPLKVCTIIIIVYILTIFVNMKKNEL
jgi:hypothetical protein